MNIRVIFISTFLLLCGICAKAQELNCSVEINSDKIQGTNKSIFETLQGAINDYYNTTTFTNAEFAANEKIECRFFLTVNEYDGERIRGDIQIQSSRPVYNSNYTTTLINFRDQKVDFAYQEGEPIVFTENTMENQLTAILNFYAYLILAVDFDSFSPRGGQPFWDRLGSIVQMAQSSGEPGWRQFEDNKNRSAVYSAYTGQATSMLRDLLYEYHLKGLDQMTVSPDKGRAQITKSLEHLSKVYQSDAMSVGLSMFKDAKLDELVNIYTKSSQTERDNAYEILSKLYPTEHDRLNKIKKGKLD
ncbi:MAG: DUF4835 family protein [Muribaculaceae bacterium]|nr:DUF4835 family protein [Muribaculaceae bacterium]